MQDLVQLEKAYYRRYRICPDHCNSHTVVFNGRRQRFCQQCGRFHALGEFEGGSGLTLRREYPPHVHVMPGRPACLPVCLPAPLPLQAPYLAAGPPHPTGPAPCLCSGCRQPQDLPPQAPTAQ